MNFRIAAVLRFIVFLILLAAVYCSREATTERFYLEDIPDSLLFMPAHGCIPDSATATKVAEAVLVSVYGEQVLHQQPFRANLVEDSVWVISGSLPKGMLGGVALIKIRKVDGKVLGIYHGK